MNHLVNARKKRVWFVLVFCGLLGVGAWTHFYWLDGLWGALKELVLGRTTYGRDYTESGFRRIGYGMTGAQVREILGEPVKKRRIDICDIEVWYFSFPKVLDANGVWGNCCYSDRTLILSNGAVSEITHEFFFD